MLKHRGTAKGESCYSWTIDFTAKRAKARKEMQPHLDEAARIKAEVVDRKVELKRLKQAKAKRTKTVALEEQIKEQEKADRDCESRAASIDASVYALKAVNPNAVLKVDSRSPQEIIDNIEVQGQIVADALKSLKKLMK